MKFIDYQNIGKKCNDILLFENLNPMENPENNIYHHTEQTNKNEWLSTKTIEWNELIFLEIISLSFKIKWGKTNKQILLKSNIITFNNLSTTTNLVNHKKNNILVIINREMFWPKKLKTRKKCNNKKSWFFFLEQKNWGNNKKNNEDHTDDELLFLFWFFSF